MHGNILAQVVSCCVYEKNPKNYVAHAWQHSIHVLGPIELHVRALSV